MAFIAPQHVGRSIVAPARTLQLHGAGEHDDICSGVANGLQQHADRLEADDVENRSISLQLRRPTEAADDDGSDGLAQGRLWSVGSHGTRHVMGTAFSRHVSDMRRAPEAEDESVLSPGCNHFQFSFLSQFQFA
jgi:hypothetical protein